MSGAFTNLSPLIGVVSDVVLLGETVTRRAVLGGVLVLAGARLPSRQKAIP